MNWLHDERIDCYSHISRLALRDYLALVGDVHEHHGGIAGQREVLKTTTAKRIRERMVGDIRDGAVLPPVVVGIVMSPSEVATLVSKPDLKIKLFLKQLKGHTLSIIDGMQRTEAFIEASVADRAVLSAKVRVDFWVAKSVRALVYRMLVLNTGQVPWTLARQLSVVYTPLLAEIKSNVPEISRLITPDKPGRRVSGGEFSSDALVELFMAFSLRKTNVDTRESLSEEFSRLDLLENVADEKIQDYFYKTLSSMAKLDVVFDKLQGPAQPRFSRGRDVFGSQPARIGFVVAASQRVMGKLGLETSSKDRKGRMEQLLKEAVSLEERLDAFSIQELRDFLKLDVLGEILDKKVGQVGRYERSVFYEAFKLLIDQSFDVPSMEPCWKAH